MNRYCFLFLTDLFSFSFRTIGKKLGMMNKVQTNIQKQKKPRKTNAQLLIRLKVDFVNKRVKFILKDLQKPKYEKKVWFSLTLSH